MQLRIFDRMTHAGLRGQAQHAARLQPLEQRRRRPAIGEIGALEREAGICLQALEPRLLQRHVVIGVQVVDADHPLTAHQQTFTNVHADEAGRAGDE